MENNYELEIMGLKADIKELKDFIEDKTIKYNDMQNKYESYMMSPKEELGREIDQLKSENEVLKDELKKMNVFVENFESKNNQLKLKDDQITDIKDNFKDYRESKGDYEKTYNIEYTKFDGMLEKVVDGEYKSIKATEIPKFIENNNFEKITIVKVG
ncbi:hypothetical protein StevenHerd11_5 [Bacillus phage StevenHerd11]|uniref:Uncharacterized protein n=1 Tax=Bacillus phage StevenHerd11 TaxID=2483852 RepID=A0A3G8F2D4_9CAUD|nr:hypothetical protein StevenHerd11_5 [Bacillus phage StevenHerd11]